MTPDPSHLPITHLGEMTADGKAVAHASPSTPYEIVLRPNAAVKSRFPNSDQHDFRFDLSQIEAGTPVYDVMARATKNDTSVKIDRMVGNAPSLQPGAGEQWSGRRLKRQGQSGLAILTISPVRDSSRAKSPRSPGV